MADVKDIFEKYVPQVKSQKLKELVLECERLGYKVYGSFDIALRNFESAMIMRGFSIEHFDIRKKRFTETGEKINSFIVDYMKCFVDRTYEFVPLNFLDRGLIYFVSSKNDLDNLAPHINISLNGNLGSLKSVRGFEFGYGLLVSHCPVPFNSFSKQKPKPFYKSIHNIY